MRRLLISALPLLATIGCSQEFSSSGDACVDADGDWYCADIDGAIHDCDDADPTVHPGAADVWYDGVDNDCGGGDDYDADQDGYSSAEFGGGDCDDADPNVSPAVDDVWYDGVDSDCDGAHEYDADGDGYTSATHGVGDATDCDDSDPAIHPGATDTWYDGIDSDCAEDDDYDADLDGYAHGGEDCDDTDAAVNPDGNDTWYDGVDSDCDGASDYDADGDGWDNQSYGGWDCDDTDASVNPDGTETWYDGVDSDCDGANDYDADGDGYISEDWGGDDCEDGDASANPDGQETLGDAIDGDCDGDDDTSPMVSLAMSSSTGLVGPRLAESDDGVIVATATKGYLGTGISAVIWHYLDPAAPWDGSASSAAFTYSSTYWLGDDYDIVADGPWVLEAYTLYEDLSPFSYDNVWLRYAVTHSSLGYTEIGAFLDTTYISGWDDIDISYDGTSVGIVGCEEGSSAEWIAYMTGSFTDYFYETHSVSSTLNTGGGGVCIVREPSALIYAANSSDSYTYTYSYTGAASLSSSSSYSGAVTDMDWTYHGSSSSYAYSAVNGTTLTMRDASASTTFTATGTGMVVQSDYDGSDLFAVYADTSGNAWLVYGTVSGGFTEVSLPTTVSAVDDVDVLVTGSGALVIAVQGDDQIEIMGVNL